LATFVVTELHDELTRIRETVLSERRRMTAQLAALSGVELAPAEANFLWMKTPHPAEEIFEKLKQRSILVRSFHRSGGRLRHYLRVTIGLPSENDRFVEALGDII
jgi:histidinol-phosphate aminotransferase